MSLYKYYYKTRAETMQDFVKSTYCISHWINEVFEMDDWIDYSYKNRTEKYSCYNSFLLVSFGSLFENR